MSPRSFHALHLACPTKSNTPGFFVLHLPTVAYGKLVLRHLIILIGHQNSNTVICLKLRIFCKKESKKS